MADNNILTPGRHELKTIGILVVDDHAVFRDGLRALLELSLDIKITGEACNGDEGVNKAGELKPDVITMDIAMPGMDGIEATRLIIRQNPKAKILMITQYEDREYVLLAIKAGARGYIPKRASGDEVKSAIRAVYHGDSFLYPSSATALINTLLTRLESEPYDTLSNREKETLRMLAEGKTISHIASYMSISPKTVLSHRSRMMKKLNLQNRTDLIKYALRKGVITYS